MSEEEKKPAPRGRGAALMEALRKAQTRPGATTEESVAPPQEPPKPRGRAALLQKLAEMKQSRAGSDEPSSSDSPTGTAVTAVTETLTTLTISEPSFYQGSSGSRVPVSCNYIRMKSDKEKGFFEYHVSFDPQIDAKAIRCRLVSSQVGKIKMFDGGSCLYLPLQLPDAKVAYQCTHPIDETSITMILQFVKHKRLSECIHFYNVLFKRVMYALLYAPIGRNYFDPNHTVMIPQHKLEVLPGYAIAVDDYEDGIMICLDTQHRVMRRQSVLDILIELRQTCRDRFKEAAFKTIVGSCILTRYNNKNYRVDEILWDQTPESRFTTADGRSISYIEYYKAQYNIDLKDTKQPLLLNMQSKKQSGTEDKVEKFICLIPELCFATGLTDEMRSDFKIMKDVAVHTRVTPNQRMHALRNYIDNVQKTPQAKEILQNWGLDIENGTIDLMARVLDPETILFGDGVKGHSEKADWGNLSSKNKVLAAVDLKQWFVFYTARDERIANEFAQSMMRLGGPMGMRIDKPTLHLLKDDRTDTYVNTLRSVIQPDIDILVFICPTSRDDRYSAIKKLCCSQMPIATQVVNSRTLSNPSKARSIIQKIAMQINCKIGGSLWSLRFPFKHWMICGIDVYHSPGAKDSVGAFISSMNESVTRWWSSVMFQDKEIGDQLKLTFAKALEKFRDTNGVFPSNVVIFRDGVGDGQLKHCQEYEVDQLQKCLNEYQLTDVKITMVVVQKRINTRLFLNKSKQELDNPMPGTIVDSTITRRNWYDFFLVAQHVRQGTVTPTHYIVVHDAAKLKPDHVQKLSYKLCHLYYNWPGTIRVPAPCMYAHKLAYLVGQHIKKVPSTSLGDRLYYL